MWGSVLFCVSLVDGVAAGGEWRAWRACDGRDCMSLLRRLRVGGAGGRQVEGGGVCFDAVGDWWCVAETDGDVRSLGGWVLEVKIPREAGAREWGLRRIWWSVSRALASWSGEESYRKRCTLRCHGGSGGPGGRVGSLERARQQW